MPQAHTTCSEHDAGRGPGANDNHQPPRDAIPFADLALAMGVDEDTLLQRLAAILHEREDITDADAAGR